MNEWFGTPLEPSQKPLDVHDTSLFVLTLLHTWTHETAEQLPAQKPFSRMSPLLGQDQASRPYFNRPNIKTTLVYHVHMHHPHH